MSKIVKKEILRLFPSLVFKGSIDDHNIVDRAGEHVNSLKKSKIGSITRGKFTTDDNLHELPQFAELSKIILEETSQVLDFYAVVRGSHYITNMWAHSTTNGHRHATHIHPNSYLSGIVYLKTPVNCGNTIFIDPRNGSTMIHPDFSEQNYFNMDSFIHSPEKGVILIWNSWLPHTVDQSSVSTEEERVVLSFNIMIKGSVQRKSEQIVF